MCFTWQSMLLLEQIGKQLIPLCLHGYWQFPISHKYASPFFLTLPHTRSSWFIKFKWHLSGTLAILCKGLSRKGHIRTGGSFLFYRVSRTSAAGFPSRISSGAAPIHVSWMYISTGHEARSYAGTENMHKRTTLKGSLVHSPVNMHSLSGPLENAQKITGSVLYHFWIVCIITSSPYGSMLTWFSGTRKSCRKWSWPRDSASEWSWGMG